MQKNGITFRISQDEERMRLPETRSGLSRKTFSLLCLLVMGIIVYFLDLHDV